MGERNQFSLGVIILIAGLVLLLGSVTGIHLWRFIWPLALIALGLYFVLRPRLVSSGSSIDLHLLGDVHRRGPWQVEDQELWVIIGDVELDLSEATIPSGETRIRVYGLVGDVDLRVPPDVAVSVTSYALLSDVDALGRKEDVFLAPFRHVSEDYESAERRIALQTGYLVVDLDIEQS
jgi:predicted membrane protein